MNPLKKLVIVASLVVLASCGRSSPIPPVEGALPSDNLSWVLATQFEDGSALTVGPAPRQIKETLLQWGLSGGPYNLGFVRVPAPGLVAVVPRGPTDFSRCYIAFTVLNDLTNSVGTGQVCKNILPPPNNPSGLTVN